MVVLTQNSKIESNNFPKGVALKIHANKFNSYLFIKVRIRRKHVVLVGRIRKGFYNILSPLGL